MSNNALCHRTRVSFDGVRLTNSGTSLTFIIVQECSSLCIFCRFACAERGEADGRRGAGEAGDVHSAQLCAALPCRALLLK
eukprot:6184716-Pleurochrysis_carterae.AAC.2